MQENQGFSASCRVKNAVNLSLDYLAVPNNLLLSLIGATGVTSPQNILAYAREAILRNSFRQRISRRILCLIFHVLSSTSERAK